MVQLEHVFGKSSRSTYAIQGMKMSIENLQNDYFVIDDNQTQRSIHYTYMIYVFLFVGGSGCMMRNV